MPWTSAPVAGGAIHKFEAVVHNNESTSEGVGEVRDYYRSCFLSERIIICLRQMSIGVAD